MNRYRIIVDTSTANHRLQKMDVVAEVDAKDIYEVVKYAFRQKYLYGAVKLMVEEIKHLI